MLSGRNCILCRGAGAGAGASIPTPAGTLVDAPGSAAKVYRTALPPRRAVDRALARDDWSAKRNEQHNSLSQAFSKTRRQLHARRTCRDIARCREEHDGRAAQRRVEVEVRCAGMPSRVATRLRLTGRRPSAQALG